jgi:hypothetical protein
MHCGDCVGVTAKEDYEVHQKLVQDATKTTIEYIQMCMDCIVPWEQCPGADKCLAGRG